MSVRLSWDLITWSWDLVSGEWLGQQICLSRQHRLSRNHMRWSHQKGSHMLIGGVSRSSLMTDIGWVQGSRLPMVHSEMLGLNYLLELFTVFQLSTFTLSCCFLATALEGSSRSSRPLLPSCLPHHGPGTQSDWTSHSLCKLHTTCQLSDYTCILQRICDHCRKLILWHATLSQC